MLRGLCLVSKGTLKKCSELLKGGKQTRIQMSKWYLGHGGFCHINRIRATAEKQFAAKEMGMSSALSQS